MQWSNKKENAVLSIVKPGLYASGAVHKHAWIPCVAVGLKALHLGAGQNQYEPRQHRSTFYYNFLRVYTTRATGNGVGSADVYHETRKWSKPSFAGSPSAAWDLCQMHAHHRMSLELLTASKTEIRLARLLMHVRSISWILLLLSLNFAFTFAPFSCTCFNHCSLA